MFWADAKKCVFPFDACCSIQAFVWRTAIWKFIGIGWRSLCEINYNQNNQSINEKAEKYKYTDSLIFFSAPCNSKRPFSLGNSLGINIFKDRVGERTCSSHLLIYLFYLSIKPAALHLHFDISILPILKFFFFKEHF